MKGRGFFLHHNLVRKIGKVIMEGAMTASRLSKSEGRLALCCFFGFLYNVSCTYSRCLSLSGFKARQNMEDHHLMSVNKRSTRVEGNLHSSASER